MSGKTSLHLGRRTPLSLSGAVTKSQSNKGSSNIANGGGINANGHPASSNCKQDNKLQQQQKIDQPAVSNFEAKENPNKKQQPQAEKKSQQNENKKANEKFQTVANNSDKQETNENKQLQQNKEKAQYQNGNDENKVNEKEKSEKSEKPQDKYERDITKSNEDKKRDQQNLSQNKKGEKKTKDLKDSTKEDKIEVSSKSDENTEMQHQIKVDDKKSIDEDKEKAKSVNEESEEKRENIYTVEDQIVQKSSNSATSKSNRKLNKTPTPVNKTPTKTAEKKTQKSTSTNTAKTSAYKREETTAIDDNDIEMEPLAIESSPIKLSQPVEAANIKIVPSATSTPGKLLLPKRNLSVPKSDVPLAMEISPDRPRMFSQISGRKSIRPISDYTPSKFQRNLQFRESYRRINTELDATNTSMNVTVGSEVPSNFSFSFFGRGRKRDRASPPHHSLQSAIGELQTDIEISPPKKARLDIHGLLSAVYSPISLLRNRFSKASLQSSTPLKLQQKLNTAEDEIEVQNVSGVSEHDEITTSDKEPADINLSIDNNDTTLGEEAEEETKLKPKPALSLLIELHSEGKEFKEEESSEQSGIKITENPLQSAAGDGVAKKGCVVM